MGAICAHDVRDSHRILSSTANEWGLQSERQDASDGQRQLVSGLNPLRAV